MPDSNVVTEMKISELPAADQANTTDQLEANQSGTTRRITLGQVSTLVAATIPPGPPGPPGLPGTISPDDIYSYGADGAGGATDLAALDTMLATQVGALPRLQVWAKTSIDVGSLIPGPDTVDPMPYLQKIFAAFDTPGMQGRHFIFGRQRAWKFQTRPSTGLGPQGQYLTPPQRCTLEWQREWDFTAYGVAASPTILRRDGSYGAVKAVVGSVARGTFTITVAPGAAAGLVFGQRLLLRATTQLTTLVGAFTLADAAGTAFCARSEDLIVQSVSGDIITFLNAVQDTYDSTATPVLQAYENEPHIHFVNPLMLGVGDAVADDRGLMVCLGRNTRISGGRIDNMSTPVRILSSLGGTVDGLAIMAGRSTGAGGGISLYDATSDFTVRNCATFGGPQTFMISGSGAFYGITRDVTFRDCVANHPFNGFTQHNLSERIIYNGVTVNSPSGTAIDIRCPNTQLRNSRVRDCPGGAAVIMRVSPNGLLIDGLTAENCRDGIILEDSGSPAYDYAPADMTVQNCTLRNIGGSGSRGGITFVYSQLHGGSFPVLGKLRLTNNFVSMNDDTVPVRAAGRWTAPIIAQNEFGPAPGASPAPATSIFVSAPTGGAATDAPSDPVVIDNIRSATYGAISVAGTGRITDDDNLLLGSTTNRHVALTANTALVTSQRGMTFTNFGATGPVTVTLSAASNVGYEFTFYVFAAQTLTVQTPSLEKIQIGSAATTASTSISANAPGAYLRLRSISSTQWIAEASGSDWTLPWSPWSLGSDLIAWWDALKPPTIGTLTFAWDDAVLGYSLSQTWDGVSTDLRPTFDGTAIDCTGNKYAALTPAPAAIPTGATAGCIWASVNQTNLIADAGQRFIFSYGNVNTNWRAVARSVNGGINRAFSAIGDGTNRTVFGTAIDFSGAHWTALIYDGALASTRTDAVSGSTLALTAATVGNRMRLGADAAATPTLFANMKIKRVLITKALSAPNLALLDAWLTARV